MASGAVYPRDRFITVYGRKPVLEVLADRELAVDKVVLATNARERSAEDILRAAAERGVRVLREPAEKVTRLSRNGRHDQGVVADVEATGMAPLGAALEELRARPDTVSAMLVLDGITNPANVGMVLRTATAAGLEGVVLPRRGTADVGPLVIKASAGIAFRAPILRSPTTEDALEALQDAGFVLLGLDGGAERSVYETDFPPRCAFVLGSETAGLSESARTWIHDRVAIPMHGGVESLNVAAAASVLAFEVSRRRGALTASSVGRSGSSTAQ